MKSRQSLTQAWLWLTSAAALERSACCRLQLDLACDLWVSVVSGRPQDVL